MDARVLLRALRRNWWVVLIAVVAATGVSAAVTAATPSQFASSVTFFVRTPAEQIGGAYQGDQFAQKRVNSYVQLAQSRRLADLVRSDTQTGLTAAEISSKITAQGDLNTVLLTLTVTDTDAARSLDIARSLSTQFVSLVSNIETAPGASNPSVSLDVTSDAALNPTAVSPRPLLNLLLGFLAGLVVGVVLAIAKELLNTTVRSSDSASELTHSPLLAAIPFDPTVKSSPLIVDSHSTSSRAEAFRQLRTNLQFIHVDEPLRVLAVSSSIPGEGKSSTATNLAVAFAEAGKRVLLIDGDMRRPRVADYLDLDGSVGLTNVLAGQVEVDEVLQPWGQGGLSVLTCGAIPPNPSELLGSQNMRDLLGGLRQTFELIIIDTPPLIPVTDGAIAAAIADATIIVVGYGKPSRNQLAASAATLSTVDARLVGCVLNLVPRRASDVYGYEYTYAQVPTSEAATKPHRGESTSEQAVADASSDRLLPTSAK